MLDEVKEKRRGQIFYFDISFFINTICQFQRSDLSSRDLSEPTLASRRQLSIDRWRNSSAPWKSPCGLVAVHDA